jgi:segregation and condensation protein A
MSNMSETYTVRIPHFEGPFDLLLYFIQRDELDIHDIPIAKMTNDFLAYIKELEALNLDVASEFILVAATLMRIKAKILIPRKEIDEEGNEIDPREELVTKLLEYKRYKEVLGAFEEMQEERSLKMQRGNIDSEVKKLAETALVDVELEFIDTYKLFKTFKRVLERYKNVKDKYVHQIVQSPYTVKEQQEYIIGFLEGKEKVSFEELFTDLENRIHAIVTFLAMLELLNAQEILLTQGQEFNDFWLEIKKNSISEEE